jgi:hypothetical protein
MEIENKTLEILDLVREKVLSPDEALPHILRLFAVSGMLKCCSCGYEYEELIIAKDGNMKCKDCAF